MGFWTGAFEGKTSASWAGYKGGVEEGGKTLKIAEDCVLGLVILELAVFSHVPLQ